MPKRIEIQIKNNRGQTETLHAAYPTKKEIKQMDKQAREMVKAIMQAFQIRD